MERAKFGLVNLFFKFFYLILIFTSCRLVHVTLFTVYSGLNLLKDRRVWHFGPTSQVPI